MELYPECPIRDCLALYSLFTFSHRTFPPGYRFAGESHDFYEAVCILGGKAEITADSRVLVLSAGEMILHPPREFHKIGTRDGSLETVIFSFRAPVFPVKGGVFSLTAEEMDRVRAMQESAKDAFCVDGINLCAVREGKEAEADLLRKRLELFLLEVLTRKNVEATRLRSRSAENYGHILAVMDEHLGERLNVAELARLCRLSVPAMEQTVHRYTGAGAAVCFLERKLALGCTMLSDGASVKETALALGFADQNYFSAVFRRRFGVPPTGWHRVFYNGAT